VSIEETIIYMVVIRYFDEWESELLGGI